MADLEPAWRTSLKKHHNELRSGILIANFLPALRLLLTDVEYIRIEEKEGRIDKVDELVKILLTKDESTFDGFCSILEKNGYRHWARILKGKGKELISLQLGRGHTYVVRTVVEVRFSEADSSICAVPYLSVCSPCSCGYKDRFLVNMCVCLWTCLYVGVGGCVVCTCV